MLHLLFQAIGIFLQGCFLFNFLTLMEYSVAGYMERRRARNNASGNSRSYSESEPSSKKNSTTVQPLFSTRGKINSNNRTDFIAIKHQYCSLMKGINPLYWIIFREEKDNIANIAISLRSYGNETICSWCICSSHSSSALHPISTCLLDCMPF